MEFVTRLHQCLTESKVAAGMLLGLNSPSAAELLVNGTQMDFIAVDLQHAAIHAGDSVHLLRAIQAADPMVTPLVRLPNHEAHWIQQSLDAGYVGLIVPLTESAEQAKKLVKTAYFPPRGNRSAAQSIRASLYGQDLNTFNDRMILLPQIESAEGLEHVEQIVAVEGVTGVLLGPHDLSLSCGWQGKDLWSYEPFLAAARRIQIACRKHGKDAAIVTNNFLCARESGFNVIVFGCDMAYTRLEMVADVNNKLKQLRRPGSMTPIPAQSFAEEKLR